MSNPYSLTLSVLESFHQSHKWLWTVVLSFSIFLSIQVLTAASAGADASKLWYLQNGVSPLERFLLFLVLLSLLLRLFGGDTRILDFVYKDLPSALYNAHKEAKRNNKEQCEKNLRDYLKRFDRVQTIADGYARVPQYILLAVLALTINHPMVFCIVLIALLITNSVFCAVIEYTALRSRRKGPEKSIEELVSKVTGISGAFPDLIGARRTWARCNLATGITLGVIAAGFGFAGGESSTLLTVLIFAIMMANGFVDIWWARKIYFPNIWVLITAQREFQGSGSAGDAPSNQGATLGRIWAQRIDKFMADHWCTRKDSPLWLTEILQNTFGD